MFNKYRPKKKINYSPLFNFAEDYARLQYNKDMDFRRFVNEWNADMPELMTWTYADFLLAYQAYRAGNAVQLSLSLA